MTTVQTDVESALRALDDEFMRHANRKDPVGLVQAFYTDDATLLPPNAPTIRGADRIRDFWKGLIDAGGADVTLETTQVDSSGEIAYGVGTYSFTMPSASGGRVRDNGKYLVVYRRQPDGTWRAVADMFGSDQPAS